MTTGSADHDIESVDSATESLENAETTQMTNSGVRKNPLESVHIALVSALLIYGFGAGYVAATRPNGVWKHTFSWHPLLMTLGMVGIAGASAVTKKRGGYVNTKFHAILALLSFLTSLGGMYAIYRHKNNLGRYHLYSWHAICGLSCFVCFVLLGIVGGVFLHPDFGISKTNKTVRYAHKMGARFILLAAWITAVSGLRSMTRNTSTVVAYAIPLFLFIPFTLIDGSQSLYTRVGQTIEQIGLGFNSNNHGNSLDSMV